NYPTIKIYTLSLHTLFRSSSGTKYTNDYRTELSKELDQKFGVSTAGLPNGLVNRRVVEGSNIVSLTKWNNTVTNFLAEEQSVDIDRKSTRLNSSHVKRSYA